MEYRFDRLFSKSRNRRKGVIVAIETTTTTTTAGPPVFNSLIGIFLINGYTTGHEASPWPVHSTDQRKDPPAIHHRFPRGAASFHVNPPPPSPPPPACETISTTTSSAQCTVTRVWKLDEIWRREIDSNILVTRETKFHRRLTL